MATTNPLENLQVEASCSVCLEYLKDPVIIDCGHNFCRACITRWWEELNRDFPCPVCRKTFRHRTLKPNRQLGNMVEIAKQLQATKRKVRDESLCEKHNEVLNLFCKEDQEAVCLVCEISHDHRSHTVVPLDDASLEYKVGLDLVEGEKETGPQGYERDFPQKGGHTAFVMVQSGGSHPSEATILKFALSQPKPCEPLLSISIFPYDGCTQSEESKGGLLIPRKAPLKIWKASYFFKWRLSGNQSAHCSIATNCLSRVL